MASGSDSFAAAEQGLGYIYQIRFALLKMFRLPEDTGCFIEKDDDLEFEDTEEGRILASLKHKAPGDRLSDLSPDFWKSVRIWSERYIASGSKKDSTQFFLFTTGCVSSGSILEAFLPDERKPPDLEQTILDTLARSESVTIGKAREAYERIDESERGAFLSAITIFDHQERIGDIPVIVMRERMRTVRPGSRLPVYERLEGWWLNAAIELMTGSRTEPLFGHELSEKLHQISSEYTDESLPITYSGAEPPGGVHPEKDRRKFVDQLRLIGVGNKRIHRAILDYYRAFEQRSSWMREDIVLDGELELYNDRLVDEWGRMSAILWDEVDEGTAEPQLQKAGKDLLDWFEKTDHDRLRIRKQVSEAYVTMGSCHILANEHEPRLHWHPRFHERLAEVLTEDHE